MKIRTFVFHPRIAKRYVPPTVVIAAVLAGLITSNQSALAEATIASSDLEEFARRAVAVDATGTGSIDDSTPLTNSRLFFRVRRDQ